MDDFLEKSVARHDLDAAPAQCCEILKIDDTLNEVYEKMPLKHNDKVMYQRAVLNEEGEYDPQVRGVNAFSC